MAIRINFDSTHNAQHPTYVLATRNGRKLGKLPAYNITVKDTLNSYLEIFFRVDKTDLKTELWDQIKDFKLMYCKEYNMWFEISVTIDDSTHLTKSITAISLGISELSQINLYSIEINTETDISRDDYSPSVLFNESDHNTSILNRVIEKAPHYKISHVDQSIANIQRTFSLDSISIYDALQEISKEINCIFAIDVITDSEGKMTRSISAYDLESYCLDCGTRDEFLDVCPKCGSRNVMPGYGEDTSIFVSSDNLADDIQYSTNIESVKNCFKLSAGDELMTATLMSCNPNGTGYIWYISDDLKEDMSSELVNRLNDYDDLSDYYQNVHEIIFPDSLVYQYNDLISKYEKISPALTQIPWVIVGHPGLMNIYYDTIDFELFLRNELMPEIVIPTTTAKDEVARLTSDMLTSVAVQDVSVLSIASANNAVLAMAKTIVDPRYQIRIESSSLSETTWIGTFSATSYSDESDSATGTEVVVEINDDYENFVNQKIEKVLCQYSEDNVGISALFKMDDESFIAEIKKYSLSRLIAFSNSCQACLDILIEQGIADKDSYENQNPDLYTVIYLPYYNKLTYLTNEIKVRESELAIITGTFDQSGNLISDGIQTVIEEERRTIQSSLDFETFIGEDLWLEFIAYRREDVYRNDNYISDGLSNAELFGRALEFIEVAKKDIVKSATLQHSLTASLKNLLVMNEFSSIVDKFAVGNWIRVRVDEKVYKLRIVDYEISYDDLDNLTITFSDIRCGLYGATDVESIIKQASSMASSYGAVTRQAEQGARSSQHIDGWVAEGLALTNMKIVDSADNQNITFDSHGLLCKEYLPITDTYDCKQLKLINRGIYLTDDMWLTSRAAIGDFTFYNPKTGKMEQSYGVIADTIVGNLILSENVGIYNENNSITLDKDGVIITCNNIDGVASQTAFTIQRKDLDSYGNDYLTQLMYVDSDGNLVLNGTIRVNSTSDTSVSTLDDLADTNRWASRINEAIHNETEIIYSEIDSKYNAVIQEVTFQLESYKADIGQYMQFDENGLTLGAQSSTFKTVIDNQRLAFKDGDSVVSYISNNQLYIADAVINNTLVLGNFFISPRADGSVSIIWQGN